MNLKTVVSSLTSKLYFQDTGPEEPDLSEYKVAIEETRRNHKTQGTKTRQEESQQIQIFRRL